MIILVTTGERVGPFRDNTFRGCDVLRVEAASTDPLISFSGGLFPAWDWDFAAEYCPERWGHVAWGWRNFRERFLRPLAREAAVPQLRASAPLRRRQLRASEARRRRLHRAGAWRPRRRSRR